MQFPTIGGPGERKPGDASLPDYILFMADINTRALDRELKRVLADVTSNDPLTYLAVVAMLGTVALLASYLPARRATRVDPLVALRTEPSSKQLSRSLAPVRRSVSRHRIQTEMIS